MQRRTFTVAELTRGPRLTITMLEANALRLLGINWKKRWRMWQDIDGSIIVEYE